MKRPDKTYNIYDGSIGIWIEGRNLRLPFFADGKMIERSNEENEARRMFDEYERERIFAETRENYDAIRMMMMNDGWTFHQDPEVKKRWRSIANSHHAGKKRDICFLSSVTGRHIEFKFYEPVIRDNPHGGQYTTDRMRKMPYLFRLQVHVAIRRITDMLHPLGYVDTSKTYPEDGLAAIMKHRAELEDFQGAGFYARERHGYNVIDADGREMFDGDMRYFWTWNGRLGRGRVYRNINNMWWVHTGPYSYTNVASFHLFTWTPAMGRKHKLPPERVADKLKVKLQKVVKSENYEQAIVLRNLLARSIVRVL